MTQTNKERIAFNVETSRVLQILSSEIYDSSKAFLRENVQNAYDAILMRCTEENLQMHSQHIIVDIDGNIVTIADNGIGMDEDVLKNHFWKAGSSGKTTALAQQSGVIGTFGIGAMANFGVCASLRVETRHIHSEYTLISTARRETLRIGEECVDFERVSGERDPGTSITAELDPSFQISIQDAYGYLQQYVRFLPVPVYLNGDLISQQSYEGVIGQQAQGFNIVASKPISRHGIQGTMTTSTNRDGNIQVHLTDIVLHGNSVQGEVFFVQRGASTHAYRNSFGLAPVPISGQYGLSGFVNLSTLTPTAGREALSRESVQQVTDLVDVIEHEASIDISKTSAADSNQQFQQYILTHGLTSLAAKVGITVQPSDEMVELGEVQNFEPHKAKHYYAGRDSSLVQRFANQQSNLLHISQTNPRRKVQIRYLANITDIEAIPDEVSVDKIPSAELSLEEAMFLLQVKWVLLDDYLIPDADVSFANISHGVAVHVESQSGDLNMSVSRVLPAVGVVVDCYKTARDVFDGFVKDFVREHIYPNVRDYVPSSMKQGSDALYQRLKANKELYRLEEDDYGEIESVLADYMAGQTDFSEVLRTVRTQSSGQRQEVTYDQVGSVEEEFPDIIDHPSDAPSTSELEAAPPIMRTEIATAKKVLTVTKNYERLNGFHMFLSLSDRLVKREGELLCRPHTTRVMWGGHRIIYVFTDPTSTISLYYDIDLKTPLDAEQTGGCMLNTTTIVTKNRIYIPIPDILQSAFKVTSGTKEFYVNFNTIP